MLLSDLKIHIQDYFKYNTTRDISILFHELVYLNISQLYLNKLSSKDIKNQSFLFNMVDDDFLFNMADDNSNPRILFTSQFSNIEKFRGYRIEPEHCRIIPKHYISIYGKVLTENERIIKNIIE